MTVLYLTFDDGPHEAFTAAVLDVLARQDARATFFQTGEHVERHPELARRVVSEGHVVGNHTWSHPDLRTIDGAALRDEIASTSALIARVTGRPPTLFRPPYGRLVATTEDDVAHLGLRTALWDIDPYDYTEPGPDAIVDRVLEEVTPGSIVLLHDGVLAKEGGGDRSGTVAALETIVSRLTGQGYSFLPLPP